MINQRLKELRQRTGMSVRAVATQLGFETHSKYAYYESLRFKGPLSLSLAKQLANMWEYQGVNPEEVLELAGLERDDALAEHAISKAVKYQPSISMKVFFPDTDALSLMFTQMLTVMGEDDAAHRLSYAMARLLPVALEYTPTWKDDPDRDRKIDKKLLEQLKIAWDNYNDTPF